MTYLHKIGTDMRARAWIYYFHSNQQEQNVTATFLNESDERPSGMHCVARWPID